MSPSGTLRPHDLTTSQLQLYANSETVRWRQLDAAAMLTLYSMQRSGNSYKVSGYPAVRAWLERVAGEPGHVGMMEETADATAAK